MTTLQQALVERGFVLRDGCAYAAQSVHTEKYKATKRHLARKRKGFKVK